MCVGIELVFLLWILKVYTFQSLLFFLIMYRLFSVFYNSPSYYLGKIKFLSIFSNLYGIIYFFVVVAYFIMLIRNTSTMLKISIHCGILVLFSNFKRIFPIFQDWYYAIRVFQVVFIMLQKFFVSLFYRIFKKLWRHIRLWQYLFWIYCLCSLLSLLC